ncbi:NEK protein kinase [Spizellomyces punctatus DAOM BR117]|uniref:non-specific serine/threonine protein kinase n=1 Tax=Spizellomyces punctatus (strain DAOM BR117) TaxID=645134 RepID=A0A0L0H985_SPIPD|nr:NEK protein kinase [Spizellomyces punctatus DAOM BR117]KNC98075.1 NEK protein kinase [Spizellomyces punctatus DAOM BR117]|eukprot:XP_016606115.1 NEK protein kinase [Spizellomyces punctatus DAOM BR117]
MPRYTVVRTLGIGSSGHVRLALPSNSTRPVCIKQVSLEGLNVEDRKSVELEALILQKLPKHPNVVEFREAWIDKQSLWIVCEYAAGGDLAKFIKARNGSPIPECLIWQWAAHIFLALSHLHSHNVLHRDIKTKNIFITGTNVLQLGDFGIARILRQQEQAYTPIGTPFYLSPEVCEGRGYGFASDIWGVGCVLYELTTLRHAFSAKSLKTLIPKILTGKYDPIANEYSLALRNLISLLLTTNPDARPSVRDILAMNCVGKWCEKMNGPDRVGQRYTPRWTEDNTVEGSQKWAPHQEINRGETVTGNAPNPIKPALGPQRIPTPSPADSTFTRIELARLYIEREIGLPRFFRDNQLYQRAQMTTTKSDEGADPDTCAIRMVRQLVECENWAYAFTPPGKEERGLAKKI